MPKNDKELRRLSDLLDEPREELDVEIKEWLDLTNVDHKAKVARGCIALANHGGGYFILGFKELDNGSFLPDDNRPQNLQAFNQDAINGVISRYAEPQFHCTVHHIENNGLRYPVVAVPGGHKVPIRASRDSPNRELKQHTYYIRRLGPKSESPQSGIEWDELIRRCLRNSKDELLDAMRDVLSGRASTIPSEPSNIERLEEWTTSSLNRWQTVTAKLPDESPARLDHGYYTISYAILGDKLTPNLAQFQGILNQSVTRYTGWPPFWLPTREGIEPYPKGEAIECWMRLDDAFFADPAHSDFWRASPEGQMFLIRGYDEDSRRDPSPGTSFDISVHTWRIGECLLHAKSLARNLEAETASILFQVVYTGLDGRRLVSMGNRAIYNSYVSRQDVYKRSVHIEAENISSNLTEIVHELLAPLYALFGFFELPSTLVQEELAKLRSRQ